jgi:hypothetical protein
MTISKIWPCLKTLLLPPGSAPGNCGLQSQLFWICSLAQLKIICKIFTASSPNVWGVYFIVCNIANANNKAADTCVVSSACIMYTMHPHSHCHCRCFVSNWFLVYVCIEAILDGLKFFREREMFWPYKLSAKNPNFFLIPKVLCENRIFH